MTGCRWGKCEGYTSPLHYVELCCAGVAAANLLHHALRLARRPAPVPRPKQLFGRDTSRLGQLSLNILINLDLSVHT